MKSAKHIPQIADSEWEVMKVLWKKSPLTAREIIDALAAVKDWMPKTVKTLLNRLVKKGALSFVTAGKNYIYSATVTQAECARAESKSFLRRVYDGSPTPMIAAFMEEEELTPEDIKELKRILDKKAK
jgi:BlaI family penicillinase repressor